MTSRESGSGEDPRPSVSLPLGAGTPAPGIPSNGPSQPNQSPPSFGSDRTPYEAIGGDERVRALADRFYDAMDSNADYRVIRDLHEADLTDARQKFYEFLSGWLGGPSLYMQRRGHPRLRMRHAPFPIGERERDQWLACMGEAMDALGITGELRAFLDGRFAHVADFMRNQPG